MKLPKRKSILIILITLFAYAFQLHAVFEGRNEQLKDYTSVRSNVNIESYNTMKAGETSVGSDDDDRGLHNHTNGAPISDSPLFFLLLGGLGYGAYMFRKRVKLS